MGGLFSAEPQYPQYYHYERPQQPVVPRHDIFFDYADDLNYGNYSTDNLVVAQGPDKVNLKPSRLKILTQEPESNLNKYVSEYNGWGPISEYEFIELDSNSSEYKRIVELFKSTTKKNLVTIISICKIENPYLMGQYLLRELEMRRLYRKVQQKLLFHGTESYKIDSICKNNFDWRYNGRKRGHKFGRGVSFSPISYYASNYCDKGYGHKQMLVAQVLISNTCVGNSDMELPPYFNERKKRHYDTSVKEDGHVVVKYNDNEFYPAYKIEFMVKPGYFNKKQI